MEMDKVPALVEIMVTSKKISTSGMTGMCCEGKKKSNVIITMEATLCYRSYMKTLEM